MRALKVPPIGANILFHDLPGDGIPLVYLHGLGCASSMDYPRIASDPALAGRRQLLVDLPGFGFSDRPLEFSYTVAAHAEVIAALVRRLDLESIDLFGHSMGGAIAIVTADVLRDRVRHLVLSEPNLDPGGGPASRSIAALAENEYSATGHQKQIRAARIQGDSTWAASMAASAAWAVHRGATSLVAGAAPSWRETLTELPMLRTVVFGEHSLPNPDLERLPESGIEVRVVANAGHGMASENPSGLAAAIARSLERDV